MPPTSQREERERWDRTWEERGAVVRKALGDTHRPGTVTSFSWDDPRLAVPGACAMTFAPTVARPSFLHMSLGITQPLAVGSAARSVSPWEFGLYTRGDFPWAKELLYDLVTGWAERPHWLKPGHFLPATFFRNADGRLDCAAEDLSGVTKPVGPIRGLFLWPSLSDRTLIEAPGGAFFIMVATLVTREEESLADETTPPHVLLLLKRLGIGQLSDPERQSAHEYPAFSSTWGTIKGLPHADAIRQLNSR